MDRNGKEISDSTDGEETSAEYMAPAAFGSATQPPTFEDRSRRNTLVVFALVSAGCATAAVVTGSYAFWLSRRRLANDALTSVHDLLETCRDRVSRMEHELSQLSTA